MTPKVKVVGFTLSSDSDNIDVYLGSDAFKPYFTNHSTEITTILQVIKKYIKRSTTIESFILPDSAVVTSEINKKFKVDSSYELCNKCIQAINLIVTALVSEAIYGIKSE